MQKVVREHYLRDDIPVEPDGGWADGACILIDTNVALHQVDDMSVWVRGCVGVVYPSAVVYIFNQKPGDKPRLWRMEISHGLVEVFVSQIDFLDTASASGDLKNVIVVQTVLEEVRSLNVRITNDFDSGCRQVKHRNVSVFNRLKTMIQTVGRRFHVFSNEHHTDTYIKVWSFVAY